MMGYQNSAKHQLGMALIAVLVAIVGCTGCPKPLEVTQGRRPLVDTGQDLCFDTAGAIAPPEGGQALYGQDAQYDGPQPAFQDNGDGTVTDLVTGLTWQQTPGDKMTYAEAVAGGASFNLAGYGDWRLPTIKELYSLIDFSGTTGMTAQTGVPYVDTAYFDFEYGNESAGERHIDAQYWSSTEYVSTTMGGEATVFGVNFADGRIKGYPRDVGPGGAPMREFVRYVRGNLGYGDNLFVDNGDGTVSDVTTGLMWAKADSEFGMDWPQALEYAESSELAAYDDWRLPNAKELQSLVDYTRAPDITASAAINPAFDCTKIGTAADPEFAYYWTSTTHLDGPPEALGTFAVYVAFGRALGYMEMPPGSGSLYLLDVHGAGAQRSDPKVGDPDDWPYGHGPQGDVIQIYNLVRCVRGGADSGTADDPPEGNDPGPGNEPPDPPEQPPTFEELDTDGDGLLSLQEALAIPDMTEDIFTYLDTNGDGYLSKEEPPPQL